MIRIKILWRKGKVLRVRKLLVKFKDYDPN